MMISIDGEEEATLCDTRAKQAAKHTHLHSSI